MRRHWKSFRYRLEWLGLSLASKLIPLLSRRACFRFAQFAGAAGAVLDRAGRRVALSNLEAAFGDGMPAKRRKEVVRESYQQFTTTMIYLLWSTHVSRENFHELIEAPDLSGVRAAVGDGPCIFACYHYGNFELLSQAVALLDYPTDIIAQQFKNPLLDSLFNRLRQTGGHRIVPRERAVVRLYKALKSGRRVAILVDLTVRPNTPAVAIDCFGLKTSVTFAHAWLHERTGVPIIPAHCEPLPGGRLRIVFHPKIEAAPGQTHAQLAQACWDVFEPVVGRDPSPWLWMYKHWRYKPKQADRPYPFYANEGEGFEALLRDAGEPAAEPVE